MADHVIKYWSYTLFCKIRIGETNDSIEVFSENAVFLLNIAELLSLDEELRARLAEFTSTNSEIIDVKMATETSRTKWNVSFLSCHYCSARLLFVIWKVKVRCLHLLVHNPSVGWACVKQSSYLLWRVVSNINVSDVGEVHVIVHVKS